MNYLIGYLVLGVILAELLFWVQRKENLDVKRADEPAIYFIAVTVGLPVLMYYLAMGLLEKAETPDG